MKGEPIGPPSTTKITKEIGKTFGVTSQSFSQQEGDCADPFIPFTGVIVLLLLSGR
jgi:hypothetical protein